MLSCVIAAPPAQSGQHCRIVNDGKLNIVTYEGTKKPLAGIYKPADNLLLSKESQGIGNLKILTDLDPTPIMGRRMQVTSVGVEITRDGKTAKAISFMPGVLPLTVEIKDFSGKVTRHAKQGTFELLPDLLSYEALAGPSGGFLKYMIGKGFESVNVTIYDVPNATPIIQIDETATPTQGHYYRHAGLCIDSK